MESLPVVRVSTRLRNWTNNDRSRGTGLVSLHDFGFINVIAWALTGVVKPNRTPSHDRMTVKEHGKLLG